MSSSHSAMAYLCTMSSKRCPPALRLSRRQPYPSGRSDDLEGRGGLPDQGPDPQRGRLADGTLGDQALGQLERGVVDEALADAQRAAHPVGHRAHFQGVLDRVGHRLLHRHVLARLERGDHMVVVHVGRRQDLDGIDGIVGQQVGQVGVERLGAPLLGGLAADLLVGVAHGHDVAAGIFEIPPHVHVRDVAGAQHAQPDLVHQSLPWPTTPPTCRFRMRPRPGRWRSDCRHNRARSARRPRCAGRPSVPWPGAAAPRRRSAAA